MKMIKNPAILRKWAILMITCVACSFIHAEHQMASAAGLNSFTGGVVKKIIAKTNTGLSSFSESSSWKNLPNASLTFTIPAATTHLVNVSFSADCSLANSGPGDEVQIRVLDASTLTILEPNNSDVNYFCHERDGYAAHTMNFFKRMSAGTHTLVVQFMLSDFFNDAILTGDIFDWTYQVVIYD